MSVDKIVKDDNVLIRAGVKSNNLDGKVIFDRDVIGRVVSVNKNDVVVDIPDYYKLRTYRIEEVVKLYH